MITEAVTTVHTSGINWPSVVAIVSGTVVFLSIIVGAFAKIISDRITNAINKFRIDVINQLDNRLTAVETKLNDIRNTQKGR
jgi:hypothetical protein